MPKQSRALKPEVETKPKRIETPRLAASLFTKYTRNAEAPERVILATEKQEQPNYINSVKLKFHGWKISYQYHFDSIKIFHKKS